MLPITFVMLSRESSSLVMMSGVPILERVHKKNCAPSLNPHIFQGLQ